MLGEVGDHRRRRRRPRPPPRCSGTRSRGRSRAGPRPWPRCGRRSARLGRDLVVRVREAARELGDACAPASSGTSSRISSMCRLRSCGLGFYRRERARVVVYRWRDHRDAASPTTSRRPGWTDISCREGRADQRLDLPRGRPRHPVQPLADDDALQALQRRALPRARRLRHRREPAHRLQPREPEELQRGASRARAIGLDVELLWPEEARAPHAGGDRRGALRGRLDPERRRGRSPHRHTRSRDAARRARRRDPHGGRASPGSSSGRPRGAGGRDRRGPIETEWSSMRAGSGRPRSRRWSARSRPSVPVDHQHIALAAVGGTSSRARCRVSATWTTSSTGRPRRAGCSSAATSRTRFRAGRTACPGSTGAFLSPDKDRFAPLMEGAIRRFPFLADAGMVALVCHPDAMTPDGNPLLGPMPGVRGSGWPPGFR